MSRHTHCFEKRCNREYCESKKVSVRRAGHRNGNICVWARKHAGRTGVTTLTDHSLLGFKIIRASLMN